MGRGRMGLLVASIIWLVAGIFFGIEGFGVGVFIAWRPMAILFFLGLNSFAAAVVVSEYVVAARPDWEPRRSLIAQAVGGLIFVISVLVYVDFIQHHAVTVR